MEIPRSRQGRRFRVNGRAKNAARPLRNSLLRQPRTRMFSAGIATGKKEAMEAVAGVSATSQRCRGTGSVPDAGNPLRNCRFSLRVTGLFFARTATEISAAAK